MSRLFFDTNVLVYMFDDRAPAKKSRAVDIYNNAAAEGFAVLSTQVLQEFFVSATRKWCNSTAT